MSEQDIKQLLYKDLQRYKIMAERIQALEKQVLVMHEFLTATAKQVSSIGEALTQISKIKENENDNSSGSDAISG